MTYDQIAKACSLSGDFSGRSLKPSTVAYHLEMLSHEMGRMRFDGGTRDQLSIDQTERCILFAILGMIAEAGEHAAKVSSDIEMPAAGT